MAMKTTKEERATELCALAEGRLVTANGFVERLCADADEAERLSRPHVFAVRVVVERNEKAWATTQFLEPRDPPAPSDSREVSAFPEVGESVRIVLRGPCYLDAPMSDYGLSIKWPQEADESGAHKAAQPDARALAVVVRAKWDAWVKSPDLTPDEATIEALAALLTALGA